MRRKLVGKLVGAAAALALLRLAPAAAARPAGRLVSGGGGGVAAVPDGGTLVLDDGRTVRLIGIAAPAPDTAPGAPPEPFGPEAREALAAIVPGRRVALKFGGAREDRHGRVLAQAWRDDGLWLQGEMLRRGLARVMTFPDNRALAADMLALENEAREDRRGLWALARHAVRRPADHDLDRDLDSFQLVAGRVLRVAERPRSTFLEFGENWRTGFSATLDRAALRLFDRDGIDPQSFAGRTLRLRGWLFRRGHPILAVTHPEQVEILD